MIKDELKGRNAEEKETKTLEKIEEATINNQMKIGELSRCLKDKDRRLRKMELRWKIAAVIGASAVVALFCGMLLATLNHIMENLPPLYTSGLDSSGTLWNKIPDMWLSAGFVISSALSIAGFFFVVWIFYCGYDEYRKSKEE